MRTPRARRSELATPASSERMCEKAAAVGADLVFLDLEDACAPAVKESSRAIVVGALTGLDWGRTVRAVRVNGIETPWCHGDIIEVVTGARDALDVLIVPKVRRPATCGGSTCCSASSRRRSGLERPIGLEVLIEEAEGLANALEIAQASERLEALIFGAGDLSASLHARVDGNFDPVVPYPGDFWHYARAQVLTAARAAMIDAVDAPYPAYEDPEGYRRAALAASALGYDGKWAIHPSQVPIANEVFSPTPAEVAEARARPWRTTARPRRAGSGPSVATAASSTPPTCGWRPTRCTRPRWRTGPGRTDGDPTVGDGPSRGGNALLSQREACYRTSVVERSNGRTRAWHVGPSRRRGVGPSTSISGTEPISYEDSISPDFYELEREAIFKRAWLNVGRVEQLPRNGSYFTKELAVARTSVIIVRGQGRRGAGLPQRLPPPRQQAGLERLPEGGDERRLPASSSASTTGGATTSTVRCTSCSRNRSSSTSTRTTSASSRCTATSGPASSSSTWPRKPEQNLRDFLGPMVTKLENYPFEEQTERWFYRATVDSNWKIYMDAFQEFYHAPVLHAKQTPPDWSIAGQQAGFEAPAYTDRRPAPGGQHCGRSTRGRSTPTCSSRWSCSRAAGSSARGTHPTSPSSQKDAGINPAGCDPWGLDSFQIFPNFVILVWGQGWYLTYHYWPTSHNTHVFEGTLYFVPAKTARERVAHEMAAASFKEYGLQDANTLEATQTMLESRVLERFPLNDQEVLCRHLHKVAAEWVDEYKTRAAEVDVGV